MVPDREEKVIACLFACASKEEWKAGAKDRVFELGSDGASDLMF